MGPEQQTTIPEKPHVHILDLVLFCLKPYFIVVKQENKVQHVNLCIFPPDLHIKFIKELRLFRYELNHFYHGICAKIMQTASLNILTWMKVGYCEAR